MVLRVSATRIEWKVWVYSPRGRQETIADESARDQLEGSPAWLKLKPKLTLDVKVTGGSGERIAWGDWGEAVMLEFAYRHPRTRKRTQIHQAVRIARQQPFELKVGGRASVVCWGVMPSGMLRHPLFLSQA